MLLHKQEVRLNRIDFLSILTSLLKYRAYSAHFARQFLAQFIILGNWDVAFMSISIGCRKKSYHLLPW